MKKLEKSFINILANGKNVKTTAVQNFLGTVHNNPNILCALGNLEMDARMYKWNQVTINVIKKGIEEFFNPTEEG